jgi:hypothetical protein
MEITGSEIGAVGWMIKHNGSEHLQETCCPWNRVWPSVIVQEDNTGTKHPAPLVLNGSSQFLQCFTVTLLLTALHSRRELE